MTRAIRLAAIGLAAAALAAPDAAAQVPTVTPDGSLSDPAAPPPSGPPAAAPPIIVTSPGQPPPPQEGRNSGYYHSDEVGGPADADPRETLAPGEVPPVHVVRTGDTLWDLSWSYFNNPWEWPRVWSYNPEITNPHWIYPGDQVRLRTPGQTGPSAPATPAAAREPEAVAAVAGAITLRQLAFVASEDLALGMAIDGSPEEKVMLAAGDEVYLRYPGGKPPSVGKRYAIYLEKERVRHPVRDEEAGAYVRVVGEVEVISAATGKRARGILRDTVDVIERGMKVGPVVRQLRAVEQAPAEADVEAMIVAEVRSEELIGELQMVFLDRGGDDRLRVGNRLFVIRRGDAYEPVMGPPSGVGRNDAHYPARSIGEVMIIEIGRRSSVAIVVRTDKEIGIGDRVLLSRSQERRQP